MNEKIARNIEKKRKEGNKEGERERRKVKE